MWRGGSYHRKDRCRNMIGPLVGFSLVDRPISSDKLPIKNCQVVQPEIASHAISSNFLMQFSIQHNAVNVLQAPTAAQLCPHCSQSSTPFARTPPLRGIGARVLFPYTHALHRDTFFVALSLMPSTTSSRTIPRMPST